MTTRIALRLAGLAALALQIVTGISNAAISYVASVKPNNAADARTFTEYYPGGRFTATAVTVRNLLRIAYRIQDYQLVGAPGWFSTQRYDIVAKAEDNPPPTQQEFLRALLSDRFQLSVHNETRDLPIFALVMARAGGKPGPQLVESDFDCAAYAATAHPLPDGTRTPACATNAGPGRLSGKSIPMAQLATTLAAFVHRFTLDRTGLSGRYDVDLTWTPEQVSDAVAGDSPGPSIFTAIQEQLGLKLVPDKGPVDVLVVDHVEKPSGN